MKGEPSWLSPSFCLSRPPGRTLMLLDISATGSRSTQVTARVVAGRKRNVEDVIAPRLAVVRHEHPGSPRHAIDQYIVVDLARHDIDDREACHGRRVHAHPGAM